MIISWTIWTQIAIFFTGLPFGDNGVGNWMVFTGNNTEYYD